MKLLGILCISIVILIVMYCVSYSKIYSECEAKGGTLIRTADDSFVCVRSDAVIDKW